MEPEGGHAPSARAARRSSAPEAYLLYLQSCALAETRTYESLSRAIRYAEQAVALDPSIGLAHAAVARWRIMLASYLHEPPGTLLPGAIATAERALEIDPHCPEAFAAAGSALFLYYFDIAAAEAYLRHAIALRPSFLDARRYLMTVLFGSGRLDEALDVAQRSVELDPCAAIGHAHVAWVHYYRREYDAAIERCRELTRLDPLFWRAPWTTASCLIAAGRPAEAVEPARLARWVNDYPVTAAYLAIVLARSGQMAEARAVSRELDDHAARVYADPYHLALVAVALGERQNALDLLDCGCEERVWFTTLVPIDPLLDDLGFRQ